MIRRWNVIEKKLTYKQAAFCREYVSNGGNGTQAYLNSYGTEDYNVAGVESHNLLKEKHIQEEIVRLSKPKIENVESTRTERIEFLKSVVEDSSEKMENRLRAIDILNRMYAEYIQRTENTNETSIKLDKSTLDGLLSE